MGYNSYELFCANVCPTTWLRASAAGSAIVVDRTPNQHWVGDLMLECRVDVVEPKGEFYARAQPGHPSLPGPLRPDQRRVHPVQVDGRRRERGEAGRDGDRPTRVKVPGSYTLRFANFDARLTVWVDGDLPFQDGIRVSTPRGAQSQGERFARTGCLARRGPTENDLQPASLGSKGAHVKVSHLRLWRDTYYTTSVSGTDYSGHVGGRLGQAEPWGPLSHQHYLTMYVQPGHYLCMGDNSPNSSDSRDWGTVPERLLLGRALVVYYPFPRRRHSVDSVACRFALAGCANAKRQAGP